MSNKNNKNENFIDKETLENLMQNQLKQSFDQRSSSHDDDKDIINFASLNSIWNKVSEYQKTNVIADDSKDTSEEFKKLVKDIKAIILGKSND
tara:strand:- start:144 stop:422 length:279 start_codon:yes stop_codon:yes gene_type:complete